MELIHSVVSAFRKGQDELVSEWALCPMRTEIAQKIFHISIDELLEEPHFLDEREAAQLQGYTPRPLELQKYDYVLECHQTEPFWMHQALSILV